jgi:hypothetical protein
MIGMVYTLIAAVFVSSTAPTNSRAYVPNATSVDSIIALMAQNQCRLQELRQNHVYNQSIILRFRRGDGKVVREETRKFAVMLKDRSISKELARFAGNNVKDGRMYWYPEPGFTYKYGDIEG